VAFEGGFHFHLLSPADGAGRFSGEGAGEFASDSAGGFLTGGFRSGHLSYPLCELSFLGIRGPQDADACATRREIVRFLSDGWRRPTFVQSPISYLLFRLLASGAI